MLEDNRLIFAHCKAKQSGVRATSFQDVVGQGLKNLGRTRASAAEFKERFNLTKTNPKWSGTEIIRLRNGACKWPQFERAIENWVMNPDAIREVHLVVTMLSKAEFEQAAAKKKPDAYFLQLIWLLAGFISTCREYGAKPAIYCLP